jgi:EAL domain-containing protein (putative c-di-GMP-specific phosphodiesterase class I)
MRSETSAHGWSCGARAVTRRSSVGAAVRGARLAAAGDAVPPLRAAAAPGAASTAGLVRQRTCVFPRRDARLRYATPLMSWGRSSDQPLSCEECLDGAGLDFEFTMAFQPFVELGPARVFGYEALVRGPSGEPAAEILARVSDANRYRFDQACRIKAIHLAHELGLQGVLSINFMPNAIYRPETCIRATLSAARKLGFDRSRLMFEVTEGERVTDRAHLRNIFAEYKRQGFQTAIDDFGSGYSGLNLLAEFQPDFLKLDMELIRNIDRDRARQAIVAGIVETSRLLGLRIIAEGVESALEFELLRGKGIRLFQGYLFARPGFRTLPPVSEVGQRLLDVAAE